MNLRSFLLGLFLVATAALRAETLTRDATVYARPEPSATVLKVLPAGTEAVPAANPSEPAPAGWMAVEAPGSYTLFADNKDVGKNLDVKAGAFFYLRADRRAPVVATMQAGDKAEFVDISGSDFTSFRVEKTLVGYIKLPSAISHVPAAPTRPQIVVSGPAATGEIGRAGMPRFYEGRFAATQNFLAYKHPYNFQLVDSTGNRFAYLDVSRLLLTDKIDVFLDRVVIIYGTVRTLNQEGTKRVIEVESLHLK
ncbi:MAG TPA: hypothetical protein VK178_03735 [Opitutaceae bacterium]|nr:hypothetical protein [Opitutaceae bacterium]